MKPTLPQIDPTKRTIVPPDPELIAAVLAAVANDSRDLIYRDDAMARVVKLAQQIHGSLERRSALLIGAGVADRA